MKKHIISIAVFLLVLLWAYAVASKLSHFAHFQIQMQRQVFPPGIAAGLAYLVPATEAIVALLLCSKEYRLYGLFFSAFLLLAFSIYITLVLANVFARVPCSCGGVLEKLGWQAHLIFNLAFLALAIAGLIAENMYLKERRAAHSES